MKSIQKLIAEFGGLAAFYENQKIIVHLDPFNDLLIESAGKSPNGLSSVSVCFLNREEGADTMKLVMQFEICDLGWYPFYFRNEMEGFEGKVYRLDESGRIASVDPSMKVLLHEAARFWDEQLARLDYITLSGVRS